MAEQKVDRSDDVIWIMVAIIAVLFAIGYFFGEDIKFYYLYLKLIQLKIIASVFPTENYLELIRILETTAPRDFTAQEVLKVGGIVGAVVNIPLMLILGWLTYSIWSNNPIQKFKRTLNMQTLKQSEQKIWPYISPAVGTQLINEPFDKGSYAMGIKPYDFAVKYNLLLEPKNVGTFDAKRAEKLFNSQLGKPFSGVDRLKSHEKALLAVFAAHGCGDKKGAMEAINQMAISAAINGINKMPDFTSVEPLYKYLENPKVIEEISRHGYVYTVMPQVLQFSRSTGVFPPSYFIWLKPRDRVLWYILNCVGRQVSFVEVAGIFGHWKAEQTAKHKLDMPFVSTAVQGLELALREVKVV